MLEIVLYAIGGAIIGAAVSLAALALLRPRTASEALLYTLASATFTGSVAVMALGDRQRSITPPAVAAPPPDMRVPELPACAPAAPLGMQGPFLAIPDVEVRAATLDAERARFGGG